MARFEKGISNFIILFIIFSVFKREVTCAASNNAEVSPDINKQNEDISLNITQLIKKNQYPVEDYTVVTPDGYKLKLFRIPGKGPVVFLMHGNLCSADEWITSGVNSGMGYLLAAQGYDVWMGNTRGNKHSRENININPSDKKFWDFSFHEMGLYDLPTMIDFVLKKTNTKSLTYIGHSQGTTAFYVMCSLLPQYNNKISLMITLSAVAWVSNSESPLIRFIGSYNQELEKISSSLGINEVAQDTPTLRLILSTFCGSISNAFNICQQIAFFLGGTNNNQVNNASLPIIFNHFPSGSSIKQYLHYGQLVRSGDFRQYDYGQLNLKKYGSSTPPSYPVEKVTAPVAIFYGQGDTLSVLKDVNILKSKLPNIVDFYGVEDKHFNHLDFVYAKDSKKLLLPRILTLIKKYSK